MGGIFCPRQLVNKPSLGLTSTAGNFLFWSLVNRGHHAQPTQWGTTMRQFRWGFFLRRISHWKMIFQGGFSYTFLNPPQVAVQAVHSHCSLVRPKTNPFWQLVISWTGKHVHLTGRGGPIGSRPIWTGTNHPASDSRTIRIRPSHPTGSRIGFPPCPTGNLRSPSGFEFHGSIRI